MEIFNNSLLKVLVRFFEFVMRFELIATWRSRVKVRKIKNSNFYRVRVMRFSWKIEFDEKNVLFNKSGHPKMSLKK